jgi:hypothetical protein
VDDERGAGLISTSAGVLVFLLFLVFAVQLLFSLYASSTVTAVAHDAAARAASAPEGDWELIGDDARSLLGRMGEEAELTWSAEDSDGDGASDTVALRIVVSPPRLVPRSLGEGVGLGTVDRTARVRLERPVAERSP